MKEDFKIRVQLVKIKNGIQDSVLDNFLVEVPEHIRGTLSNKTEAPFLVAQGFFERLRRAMIK